MDVVDAAAAAVAVVAIDDGDDDEINDDAFLWQAYCLSPVQQAQYALRAILDIQIFSFDVYFGPHRDLQIFPNDEQKAYVKYATHTTYICTFLSV